jgi:hypothetical protein
VQFLEVLVGDFYEILAGSLVEHCLTLLNQARLESGGDLVLFGRLLSLVQVFSELLGKFLETLEISLLELNLESLLGLQEFSLEGVLDKSSQVGGLSMELGLELCHSCLVRGSESLVDDFLHLLGEGSVLKLLDFISVLLSSVEVLGDNHHDRSDFLGSADLWVSHLLPDSGEGPVSISVPAVSQSSGS